MKLERHRQDHAIWNGFHFLDFPKVLGENGNEIDLIEGDRFEMLFWRSELTDTIVQTGVAIWDNFAGHWSFQEKPGLEMAMVLPALHGTEIVRLAREVHEYLEEEWDHETLGPEWQNYSYGPEESPDEQP